MAPLLVLIKMRRICLEVDRSLIAMNSMSYFHFLMVRIQKRVVSIFVKTEILLIVTRVRVFIGREMLLLIIFRRRLGMMLMQERQDMVSSIYLSHVMPPILLR